MSKQIKIKEIAALSGVSAGTVDRILHNRGSVSEKSRRAVEAVLAQYEYKLNIHTSAVSLKKGFRITIVTPVAIEGEYWSLVRNGFDKALAEFSDIRIEADFRYYDQFDVDSCKSVFEEISDNETDGVIIGPVFVKETIELCTSLGARHIPYVFMDAGVDGTNPVASFSTDQRTCGRLIGHLLTSNLGKHEKIALFSIDRKRRENDDNSKRREEGLEEYLKESGREGCIIRSHLSLNEGENGHAVELFSGHPEIRAAAIMNTRGHIIANLLKCSGIRGIKVVSFDLTSKNLECIKEGSIFALLCQRPQLQGFSAIKAMISHLLYKNTASPADHFLPIDIVMKENLPYYREVIDN